MAFGPRSLPPDADPTNFYACPVCAATFKNKRDLRRHLREVHDDRD